MNKSLCLLLLATPLALGNRALADLSDYNTAYTLDNSAGLPTDNVPRFKACHTKVSVLKSSSDGTYYFYYTYEAMVTPNKSVVMTNYFEWVENGLVVNSNDTEGSGGAFADAFYYAGNGLYGCSGDQDACDLLTLVNGSLQNQLLPNSGLASLTEHHDGRSFSVSCDVTNALGFDECHFEVSREYDGAVLPTRNMNQGRDIDACPIHCADCAGHAMPEWDISQPYLNLWVRDTPVFYKTSLGQEVAFTVNYKQRDTRPRDDGQYPTTGWNHNWYSYVRFDVPTFVIGNDTSKTNITGFSVRGFQMRQGWQLTNDWTQWEAILYAPDNGESYFSAGGNTDPQNQRTLVPKFDGGVIGGFRLVHGDGSQDIYSVAGSGQSTYGIAERYGCLFDKGGLTNGMEGVWRQRIFGSDTPHSILPVADDGASYTSDAFGSLGSQVVQCDYYDDSPQPDSSQPIAYTAYDAVLTARVDAFGNAITLGYATNRLSTITDYDGRTNYLSYDTNGYLQSVTMPYGRAAHFNHDSAGNLQSITDAQGMSSSMTYVTADGGINRRLASLTTPYGTTQFGYQDDTPYVLVQLPSYYAYSSGSVGLVDDTSTVPVYVGESSANHAIMVTHPDSSKELYFYCGITNGSHVPRALSVLPQIADQVGSLVDNGGDGGEASLLGRNCFHWGRAQTPLLSMAVSTNMVLTNLTAQDFLVGTWQHYPADNSDTGSANWNIAASPTFIREGSPDGANSGNITWFTYDNQGPAWQVSGEPGNWNRITGAPDGSALVSSFVYDSSGLPTEISKPYTDPNGLVGARNYSFGYTEVSIGDAGTVKVPQSSTWPGGGSVSLNAPQAATVNGYTVLSWPMVESTDSLGNVNQLFFNARHQLSGVKQANGLTVTNIYGSDGFLQKSIVLQALATNTYVFQNGELASQTTPLGLTLSLTHDLLGRLTGVGFPDGTTLSNVFDKLDVVATKDRLGHWSYATFDSMRQLRSVVDRNGGSTTLDYCNCGGLQSVTDPEQHTTTYLRDYLGRVTNVVSAAGSVITERDNLGQPLHLSSNWGLDLWLGHNYQGLLTGITNPAGTAFSTVYDEADLPVSVTDGTGVSTTSTFDTLGRLISRNNAFGQLEYNEYTAQGLSWHYDALGYPTSYGYDSAGRLSAVTNANGEVTQVGYDVPHRRVSLTDGRNHTKWWALDTYGRQVAETNANGVLVRTNGYDANSNLITEWAAAKGSTTFYPDNNGNILSIHYPHSTINFTYDYLNRLLTMSDGLGSHTFSYANFGAFDWAPASEAGPLGTISHGYSGPNLASISIGSWAESITRDSALRPATISSFGNNFTYSYNGAGQQLASLAMPGSTTTFGYDAVGNQTDIQVQASGQTVDYHGYGYNGNGWITTAQRRGSPNDPQSAINYTYGYDNIGQLTSVQALEPDGYTVRLNENLGYTYDASHNLASRTANTLSQTFTSDALNQLAGITRSGTLTVSGSFTGAVATLGVNGKQAQLYSDATFATAEGLTLSNANNLFVTAGTNAGGQLVLSTITSSRLPVTVSFSYDSNGNLTNDRQRVLEYDDANRLIAVTVSNSWRSEFTYDGLGRRRVVKDYGWRGSWTKTNETRYVCDGYLPVQERDASGNVLVTYTRGLDMSGSFQGAGGIGGLLARTDGSGSAFYHADVGGNITSLTDSSGGAVGRYLHDPFGRTLGKWGPMADVNAMQFSSMPVHRQSALSLYPFRAYDPTSQRWLNQDLIGETGGVNLHGFVGNNPVSNVDPYGLSSLHDYLFLAGQGIYDTMMGDQSGRYDRNMKGSIEADMGMGIDRDNNVLRDSMGGGLALLGDMAEEAAIYYFGGKVMEAGLGIAGAVVCKAKPFLGAAARAIGGSRMHPSTKLAKDEIALIKREFSDLGGDVNKLRFVQGAKTGFVGKAEGWKIIIGGDILPLEGAIHPRSAMSIRAVLAHELGHVAHGGTSLKPNAWNDELRASYWAAKNLSLSVVDRAYLIGDAISRAAEKNVRIRLNSFMTDILTQ